MTKSSPDAGLTKPFGDGHPLQRGVGRNLAAPPRLRSAVGGPGTASSSSRTRDFASPAGATSGASRAPAPRSAGPALSAQWRRSRNLRRQPLVLPPTRRLFRETNASLLAPRLADLLTTAACAANVVFAYLPTATTLALLDRLSASLVVYDCVDNFYGLPVPPENLAATEAALMSRAALVLTTSRTLYEDKKDLHPNFVELHHSVCPSFFLPPHAPRPARPLCYFGTVWRARLRAAEGPGRGGLPRGPHRVESKIIPSAELGAAAGPVAHEDLPEILGGYDALLLPYVDDEYNRGVIPAKTYECLATGLAVLASPCPPWPGSPA